MLQAYVDESCTDGVVFVMAGYVATVEEWMAFSDEWADLLRLGPPSYRQIDEFHMAEMTDSPVALEQSEHFYRVIERHLNLHVSCSVRIRDLEAAFEATDWPDWLGNPDFLKSEYYASFDLIVKALAENQTRTGIAEPVGIIFDNNSNQAKCLKSWRVLKRMATPEVRALLGDTPNFRDSAKTMPLQAADMLAYWIRVGHLKGLAPGIPYPWRARRHIRGFHFLCTREMIERNFRNIVQAAIMMRSGVDPAVVRATLSASSSD